MCRSSINWIRLRGKIMINVAAVGGNCSVSVGVWHRRILLLHQPLKQVHLESIINNMCSR